MKKSDSAVSEVVGVLLLLTITLILVSLVVVAMSSAVSTTEKPVRATIIASGINITSNNVTNVTFENIAGDAFVLDQVELRLGIREYPSQYITLRGSSHLKSYSGLATISLGDWFYIQSPQSDEENVLRWGSFNVSSGSHLTYRFYDLRPAARSPRERSPSHEQNN